MTQFKDYSRLNMTGLEMDVEQTCVSHVVFPTLHREMPLWQDGRYNTKPRNQKIGARVDFSMGQTWGNCMSDVENVSHFSPQFGIAGLGVTFPPWLPLGFPHIWPIGATQGMGIFPRKFLVTKQSMKSINKQLTWLRIIPYPESRIVRELMLKCSFNPRIHCPNKNIL